MLKKKKEKKKKNHDSLEPVQLHVLLPIKLHWVYILYVLIVWVDTQDIDFAVQIL